MVQRNTKFNRRRHVVRRTLGGIPESASGAKGTKCRRRPFGQEWALPSQPPSRNPAWRASIPMSGHALRVRSDRCPQQIRQQSFSTWQRRIHQDLGIRHIRKNVPHRRHDHDNFRWSVRLWTIPYEQSPNRPRYSER